MTTMDFCGLRGELSYTSKTNDHFHYFHSRTFSMLAIENMLSFFYYTFDGKLHLYWLLPRKDFTYRLQYIINKIDVRDGEGDVCVGWSNLLVCMR
jgi:hypothetical protein